MLRFPTRPRPGSLTEFLASDQVRHQLRDHLRLDARRRRAWVAGAARVRIDYPWTVGRKGQGQDVEEFQYFERWFAEIGDRAARHGGGQRAVDGRIEALAQGIVSDGNGPAEFDTSAECR